jgi:hypothetical protein
VNLIFNNITGILSDQAATIFTIKVMQGNDTQYNNSWNIKNSSSLLLGMRYMVQEYILGGLTTRKTVDTWYKGFTADFFDIVT